MPSVPTTLKLPSELKDRVASIVEGTGKSPHAFMLEAIEQQTRNAEKRKQFVADGQVALQETRRTGKAYRLEEAREYMQAKMAGKKPARLKAGNWPR